MDSEPVQQPTLHLDGIDYPLVVPDDMTLGEQREFEKIAGAGIDKLDNLETDFRTGLVVAWMAVTIKRAKPNTPLGQIVKRLDDLKSTELAQVWDQVGQSPPPTASPGSVLNGSASSGAATSGSDSEATLGTESRNGSGHPGSDTGLASDPATLAPSQQTS